MNWDTLLRDSEAQSDRMADAGHYWLAIKHHVINTWCICRRILRGE